MAYLIIGLSVCLAASLVACYLILESLKKQKSINLKKDSQLEELTNKNNETEIDKSLIKEMERLSIVAKQTDNAIMIMSPNGDIEWINDGFTRMYEYTFEEFIRKRGDNILKTSFNPKIRERLERCKSTLKPVYYEAINVMPSGKEIWTHTSLTPILDNSGNLIHLATIDSDISRRKEAGDALIERVNTLSQNINVLTSQQAKLFQFVEQFLIEIGTSNKKIGETDVIVKFIKELSDKIRIMGLNASIEAHTVGEKGNGFRVLSNEIIKISDETNKQVAKITSIVNSIKSSSDEITGKKNSLEEATSKYQKVIEELKNEVELVDSVANRLR